MKKRTCKWILLLALLAASCGAKSQNPSANYIRTRRMLNTSGNSYIDQISYYDGLGRPFQTMKKSVLNGTAQQHLATLQEYDAQNRPTIVWLPIATATDYLDPVTFKSNAPGNYGSDSRPYSQTVYEASPLNRVSKQYGEGAAWYGGHGQKAEYTVNTIASPLNCIRYTVSDAGALSDNGNFAANLLNVVKSTDEDGNTSYTFTDKMGRTVLVRQMKGTETHDTYSVYDDWGNLRFVLQPMYQSSSNLEQHAFQYRYDGQGRCIYKKLPGAQYMEYVYNTAGMLTFSQDGNQRAQGTPKWTYYLYDTFGRLTQQGECTGKDASSNTVAHVRNYYDDYSFVGGTGFPAGQFPPDPSGHGKGSLTGSVITVPGSGTKLYAAHYYDIRGREVKTVQGNILGGYDVTSTVYTFTDKPATVTHTHTASGKDSRTEAYTYSYDHADRLSKVEHTLGGAKVTLAAYAYDNLGRLQSKSLHGSDADRQAYTYNVRGWLTGISGSKFTQNLYYNTGNGPAKYNGSISSMTWKAGTASTVRGYKFTYDGLDRMLNATYGETAGIGTNANRFSENVTGYDKNGNIKSLQRYGQTGASAYGLLDNLTFTLNGNQLSRVDDAVTASAYGGNFEFKDGVKQANEYAYDANGNLTKDLNKGITGISYNCLNLPNVVTFSDGSTITYTYGADGTKLRTVHKTGSTTTTTDYCGNVIYENGNQKLLLTEEGYINLTGTQQYHYYLKDHQGNNRVVINQSGTVEETNHYYPFGGVFGTTGNTQPYKYNGKELDTKKGLNWYDYGARHYDAALGRFTTVDASAENYFNSSPYAYCGNSPITRIDPDGMDYWSTNNPEIIRQFLEVAKEHSNASGNILNEVNFSSWNHSTDSEFLSNLTFNDQTNMFYSNYGTIENGVVTSIGVSFPALGNNGESAWLEGGKGRWYRKASGKLDNTYPEFALSTSATRAGLGALRWIWNSLNPTFSPINTINANAAKDIAVKGFKETKKFGHSHGQKIYEYKGKYYSKDVDSHNGGAWKVFKEVNGKLVRIGTADKELNIFKK